MGILWGTTLRTRTCGDSVELRTRSSIRFPDRQELLGNADTTAGLCRCVNFSVDASSRQVIIGAPDHWHVRGALPLGMARHLHGNNPVTALSCRQTSTHHQSRRRRPAAETPTSLRLRHPQQRVTTPQISRTDSTCLPAEYDQLLSPGLCMETERRLSDTASTRRQAVRPTACPVAFPTILSRTLRSGRHTRGPPGVIR